MISTTALIVAEDKTAQDNPSNPSIVPNNIIKPIKDPIPTNAEYPTFSDIFACNFALKIEETVRGTKERIIICKP